MIDIFPYSNLHNLNLDWVIETIKKVADSTELTAEQIAAADVDGNGTVDSTDSFYIMYYVALHGAGYDTSWEEVLAK